MVAVRVGRAGVPGAVPLCPELAGLLAETPAPDRRGFVLPGTAGMYQRDNGAAVSKMIRGRFAACGLEGVNTRKALTDRRKAGQPPGRLLTAPLVTFHSLRHSLITNPAKRGTPLAAVRKLVGHSLEVVQRAYLHIRSWTVRDAIAVIPSIGTAALRPDSGSPARTP